MVDIPLNADVECVDGACGESVTVIVDPVARKVTHLVVEDREFVQRLVPVDEVAETTSDSISLHCSRDELSKMEPFLERHYVKKEEPNPDYYVDQYIYQLPYVTPTQIITMPVDVEHIPPGEVAVRRDTLVEATDGHVGKVSELVVDPAKGEITHFILQEGHLWGKKEVSLPLSAVDHTEEETVYLKLDKKAIESFPSVPVKRHYSIW